MSPTSGIQEIPPQQILAEAPRPTFHYIDLPLTTLHYVKCGQGPPLIIIPATISEIDKWLSLTQFMGQNFTAYFFELPGHGNSTPFPQSFTSEQVALTVEHLANALGFDTFSLMGFSFGGLLTLKTIFHLEDRLDQVILLAPVATHRALTFNKFRKAVLRKLTACLSDPAACRFFTALLHNDRFGFYFASLLRWLGQIEENVPLERRLKEVSPTTIQVLVRQLGEVLTLEYPPREKKLSTPCYFAMSVLDPLLDFNTTLTTINSFFEQITIEKFYFPYHQPKVTPSFSELNRDFSPLLNMIK